MRIDKADVVTHDNGSEQLLPRTFRVALTQVLLVAIERVGRLDRKRADAMRGFVFRVPVNESASVFPCAALILDRPLGDACRLAPRLVVQLLQEHGPPRT
ncbi:MAG: hypothetical protein KF837_15445 [Labilithrix sp.]|nr:hypothetical protein [Labilithrix sp.]